MKRGNVATTTTIVSVEAALPESVVKTLHAIFDMQDEFANESKFSAQALEDAVNNYAKYRASQVIAERERLIQKTLKNHKEFTYDQAVSFLKDTKSGKQLENFAKIAENLKKSLA